MLLFFNLNAFFVTATYIYLTSSVLLWEFLIGRPNEKFEFFVVVDRTWRKEHDPGDFPVGWVTARNHHQRHQILRQGALLGREAKRSHSHLLGFACGRHCRRLRQGHSFEVGRVAHVRMEQILCELPKRNEEHIYWWVEEVWAKSSWFVVNTNAPRKHTVLGKPQKINTASCTSKATHVWLSTAPLRRHCRCLRKFTLNSPNKTRN